MKTPSVVVAFSMLPTYAFAAPAPQASAPANQPPFFLRAVNSGSPVQNVLVAANNNSLWLNKDTTSYCPDVPNVECPAGTTTSFVGGFDSLSMNTLVPGGQRVFVETSGATTGRVRFSDAHVADPAGVEYSGFGFAEGALYWNNTNFLACQTDATNPSAYELYANLGQSNDCLKVLLRAPATEGAGAWQYE